MASRFLRSGPDEHNYCTSRTDVNPRERERETREGRNINTPHIPLQFTSTDASRGGGRSPLVPLSSTNQLPTTFSSILVVVIETK